MKTIQIKNLIEQNRQTISKLLSGNTFRRLNGVNWIRHELSTEAEILFQFPKDLPQSDKKLYIDYNNLKNLGNAWDYIVKNRNKKIDYLQIRKVHSILAQNTNISAGTYRFSDLFIEQLGVNAPPKTSVIFHIDDIVFNIHNEKINPLTRAFNTHYDLIETQAFNDFNKRTARMIMNWVLIQNDYRPIIFNQKSDRDDYMNALRARAHGDCKAYSGYMYACMLRTQTSIIKILQNSKIV